MKNGNANEISNLKIGWIFGFMKKKKMKKCGGFQQDSEIHRNLKQRQRKTTTINNSPDSTDWLKKSLSYSFGKNYAKQKHKKIMVCEKTKNTRITTDIRLVAHTLRNGTHARKPAANISLKWSTLSILYWNYCYLCDEWYFEMCVCVCIFAVLLQLTIPIWLKRKLPLLCA